MVGQLANCLYELFFGNFYLNSMCVIFNVYMYACMHVCMYHYVFVYTCKSPHGDPMNKIKDWISCLKLFQQVIKILGGNICAERYASVYLYYLHIQKEKCMYIGQCKCTCIYTTKDPHRIKIISGWWLGHPSEKYEFVHWDDNHNPIWMGK